METEQITLTVPVGYGDIARAYALEAVRIKLREDLQAELLAANQPAFDEVVNEVDTLNPLPESGE